MSPYLRRITEYLSVPVERKEHLTIESDPNCYVGTYRSGINTVNRIYRLALDEKTCTKALAKAQRISTEFVMAKFCFTDFLKVRNI